MVIDFLYGLRIPVNRSRRHKLVVKIDDKGHLRFRCSRCGSNLILYHVSVDKENGVMWLQFFCPTCGLQYYGKIDAIVGRSPLEIPLMASKVYGIDVSHRINKFIELALSYIPLYEPGVPDGDYLCFPASYLDEKFVRKYMGVLGLGEEFLEKYTSVWGDTRLRYNGERFCISKRDVGRGLRKIIERVVKPLNPVSVLNKSMVLYGFGTNLVDEPIELLSPLYGVMVNTVGFIIRKIDGLRAVINVLTKGFSGYNILSETYNVLASSSSQELSGFNDVLRRLPNHIVTEVFSETKLFIGLTVENNYYNIVVALGTAEEKH